VIKTIECICTQECATGLLANVSPVAHRLCGWDSVDRDFQQQQCATVTATELPSSDDEALGRRRFASIAGPGLPSRVVSDLPDKRKEVHSIDCNPAIACHEPWRWLCRT
jgi:hypothetical protein